MGLMPEKSVRFQTRTRDTCWVLLLFNWSKYSSNGTMSRLASSTVYRVASHHFLFFNGHPVGLMSGLVFKLRFCFMPRVPWCLKVPF